MFNKPSNAQRQAWRSAAAHYKTKLPNICSVVSLTSGAMCETWPIEKFSGEYLVTGSSAGEHSSGYKSFPTLEEAEDYLFDLHRGGFAHSDFVDEPSVFDE